MSATGVARSDDDEYRMATKSPLFELDPGLANDLRPTLGVGGHVGAELLRRSENQGDAARLELRAYVGAGESLAGLLVQEIDDGRRRLRGGEQGEPGPALDLRVADLGHGRDVGQHWQALRRGDGQAADTALLDM